jgi:RimJ/RimL family protein N-acetyltransferase
LIRPVFFDDEQIEAHLALWAARRIWPDRDDVWRDLAAKARVMAVYEDNHLLAVMVYHNWDPKAGVIEISGAAESPRWLTRQTLHSLYSYPFDALGCQLVVQRNAASNKRVNRILKKLGFHPVTVPRLRGVNEDEIIWTLTVEDWRASAHVKHIWKRLGTKAA